VTGVAGVPLLIATVLLVLLGCTFYLGGWVGWAQLLWVLGSGTAGAGVALMVEGRR
jgi:hypothetical protein